MVPRVAMLTTAGETRLTMGASDGIGAASGGGRGAGSAANARRHVEHGRCERGRRECETQIHAQSLYR